jgi:hypothetical protein
MAGLTIDGLSLQFDEVDVDTGAQKLRNVASARFEARISGEHLDYSVRDRYSNIRDLRVELVGNKLQVTARPEAKIGDVLDQALQRYGGELGGLIGGAVSTFRLGVPVTATGRLVPQNNTRLAFEPDRARVSGVTIPGPVLDWIAGRLNTVVDLSGFAVPVRVRHAEVRNGFLVLSGDIAPEEVLKAVQ